MSNGNINVMRPGVPARPRYCHVCGWERTSEADFVQPLRGYMADYLGKLNPVYQTTCINCGNPSLYPYNHPAPAGFVVPDDMIGVIEDVCGIAMGVGVVAAASVVWVPPVLTSITPTTAKKNSPDLTIVLVGDDFQDGAVVWADAGQGTVQLVTQGVDQQNLTAVIPAAMMTAVGIVEVKVVNPDGQQSGSMGVQIYAGAGP